MYDISINSLRVTNGERQDGKVARIIPIHPIRRVSRQIFGIADSGIRVQTSHVAGNVQSTG